MVVCEDDGGLLVLGAGRDGESGSSAICLW